MDDRTEALISSASDNGWDFFKGLIDGAQPRASAISEQQLQEAQQLVIDAARVFSDQPGKRVLDWLVGITLNRATFVSQLGLPMEQAYGYGCMREGQNGIVFTLLKMIAEGRKEQPPKEREHVSDPSAEILAAANVGAAGRRRRRKR